MTSPQPPLLGAKHQKIDDPLSALVMTTARRAIIAPGLPAYDQPDAYWTELLLEADRLPEPPSRYPKIH